MVRWEWFHYFLLRRQFHDERSLFERSSKNDSICSNLSIKGYPHVVRLYRFSVRLGQEIIVRTVKGLGSSTLVIGQTDSKETGRHFPTKRLAIVCFEAVSKNINGSKNNGACLIFQFFRLKLTAASFFVVVGILSRTT